MLKIKKLNRTEKVFDITVENSHNFYANGVLVSNCCEIIHPTVPIKSIDDPDGEIGICILAALNLLELKDDQDIRDATRVAVRTLESVIEYQDYPVLAGENFTKDRRSLGIGITNLAGFLAKKKLTYGEQEALKLIHETMESIQYHLLLASCELAAELGFCNKFDETKYAKGLLPIDWYKKAVDEIINVPLKQDWEGLREMIKIHGLRHSTLSAQMPCESSSVIQNSTNGQEPVRSLLISKKAKNGILKQIVPNYSTRKNFYTMAWEMEGNKAVLDTAAVMQKFIDMSMSTNLYYNYAHYDGGNIPLSALIKDQLYGYKIGLKNFYYANSPDADGDTEKEMGCEGGSCSI